MLLLHTTAMMACVAAVTTASIISTVADSASSPSAAQRRSLYFESHGRDDLREWPAAIAKGARYLKVDFNFQENTNSCAVQHRLPSPGNASAYPNGCFVLCHYYSNWTKDFNTTLDLLHLLAQPAMQSQLAALPDASDGIVVQLSFKNKPALTCSDSDPLSAKWITLMDAFYAEATALLSVSPSLNVRFVFDSLEATDDCAFDRWPAWSSTYTGGWPMTALNNSGLVNEKYQMVNMNYADKQVWSYLGDHGFYKFPNASYAFVAWEPSDQIQIQDFLNTYLSYDLTPAHAPGMIMAYNSDPALFHVFTANVTHQHSNVAVGSPKSKSPTVAYIDAWGVLISCAQSTTATPLTASGVITVECSALARGQNARFVQVPSRLAEGTSLPTESGSIAFLFAANTIDSIYVDERDAAVGADSLPLVISSGPALVKASVSRSAGAIVFNVSNMPSVLVNDSWVGDINPALLVTKVTPSPLAHCFDVMVTAMQQPGTSFNIVVGLAQGVCLNGVDTVIDPVTIVKLLDPFRGLVPTSSKPNDLGMDAAFVRAPDNEYNFTVTFAADRSVYVVLGTVFSRTGRVMVSPAGGGQQAKVGVGRRPHVHMGTDGFVTLTYGDSFCYNAELVDDDMYLFYGVKECDLQNNIIFEVLPNPVLVYVYGHFSDIIDRVGATNTQRQGFATVCDDTVLHGSFDLGYGPIPVVLPKDAARFGDDSIADGTHWVVAASESLPEMDLVCMCGSPVSHGERVVIDAFPMRGFYNRSAVSGS